MPSPDRDQIVINGQTYNIRESQGRRQWEERPVDSQPGDAVANPHLLVHHGGFGATIRHTQFNGQPSDPTHHDISKNVNTTLSSVIANSPRATFFDALSLVTTLPLFRIGHYPTSVIGGDGSGASSDPGTIGGISGFTTPQQIVEFGRYLYAMCGTYTIVIDPDRTSPVAVEAQFHGNTAQARSGDRFNDRLVVALGSAVDAAVVTAQHSIVTGQSTWTSATNVKMDVYKRGSAGRLFSARDNLVFNVLPGDNPATIGNYAPSTGEVITDPSDPVRSLTEFASALVAGTARTARTIDPDRNFQSVSLIPESRLSASDYDGRGAIAVGPQFFQATSRGVNQLSINFPPEPVGPELFVNNASEFRGGEPGVPDYTGNWIAWPYYFPSTGDSVIFLMRRRQSEAGTGRYEWHDFIHLPDRECRVVRFWGGSTARGPRLFFGASTPSSALQFGWVDMGKSMTDLIQTTTPATSGELFYPADDFGQPGVTHEVERIEMPWVENADANNYMVWSVAPDLDDSYIDLVATQSGSNNERVTNNGFQIVYAPDANIPMGKLPKFRLRITQSAIADSYTSIRGNPIAYIASRPSTVKEVTATLDVEGHQRATAEEIVDELQGFLHEKVQVEILPGNETKWIRISEVRVTESEVHSNEPASADRRFDVRITFRVVAT